MYRIKSKVNFSNKMNNNHLLKSATVRSINETSENLMAFKEIPGPKSYPIIGSLYNYLPFIGEYNAETLDKNAWLNWKRYGPLVREDILPGTSLLHVYDPDDIEAVFRQEGRIPARRSHLAMLHYRNNKPTVYNTGGLLATNGPEWWRLRSTFQKNFTSPKSVQYYVNHTDLIVQQFIRWIESKKPSNAQDFLPYLNRLNLEIIGKIGLGETFNSFTEKEMGPKSQSSKMITAAFDSNSGIFKLDQGFMWKIINTPLYRKLTRAQNVLESVSKSILLRKAKYFKNGTTPPQNSNEMKSLVDTFLQQSNLDMKDVTGMMVDMLMAAIDTTSYSLSFALYYLALNPKCQEELYNEARNLLPEENTPITPELLSKAMYLRCSVKESLRLNPVSIGVGRILQKDIVLRGYLIPTNTVIVTQNMVASRLPQYVNNPLTFNPRRWQRDSDSYENLHPFLSLPFGFGPRSCIARRLAEQNMCITLLRMVRHYEIRWNGGQLGIRSHLINKPDRPIKLTLIPRTVSRI